jgi:hypothetical protein
MNADNAEVLRSGGSSGVAGISTFMSRTRMFPTVGFVGTGPRMVHRRAFAAYGTHALWNKRALENLAKDDALVIARALHIEGDREARRLAEQIEQTCRAALYIQTDVLRLLASHRDPESYVAGATPLSRNAPRYSSDIDVFHDREERVATAALDDSLCLKAAGYQVSWLRQLPLVFGVPERRS